MRSALLWIIEVLALQNQFLALLLAVTLVVSSTKESGCN